MKRVGLSGRASPGLDPCAAVMTEMTLTPGETRQVVFVLGQADDLAEVHRLIHSTRKGMELMFCWPRCNSNGTAS